MKTNDPFARGVLASSELYRQARNPLDTATSRSLSHVDNLKRLMGQIDGPLLRSRAMQSDLHRNTVDMMLDRIHKGDGFSDTMRAVEDARKQRDLFVRTLAGTDFAMTRDLASTIFDTGISRTAESIRRNGDTIASVIAASRPREAMVELASSVMRRMDVLRFAGLQPDGFSKSTIDLFAEQFSKAQRIADELESVETEEERAALLMKLIAIIAAALKTLSITKRDAVLGLSITLGVIGLTADVKSLLPTEPPPGLSAAQVRTIEETRHNVDTLLEEFHVLRNSEDRIDEAYVADLPRAELSRQATIRSEPRRDGKALFKAPAGTLLAIGGSQGLWKHAIYRDPLTDQLAQAWVYGSAVTPLNDE